jgi:KUP system potassium uptake protein
MKSNSNEPKVAVPQKQSEKWLSAIQVLTALGVVYGDIGTSPIYALRESFRPSHGLAISPENILGILSIIVWSLILVISFKYLGFILRADNHGEGGILALTTLATSGLKEKSKSRWSILMIGLFGTALLFGDGMITPAISVLSAVEGLETLTPAFSPFIIPITIGILLGLFAFQRFGTEKVGRVFGPITFIWFLLLGGLGIWQISQAPEILQAIFPNHAVLFFFRNGWLGFLVLGSVFLVITGGEALYSDLGHFGKRPIRLAWFSMVLPALVLNYLGQGGLLLRHPENADNPFFLMAPKMLLLPLVLIATAATVIASQALITGVFSLCVQAIQLGYMPRVPVRHTSSEAMGQIYVQRINFILLVACIALVVGFRSSSNLAAAYGVAVTTTMVSTTLLFYIIARKNWNWNPLFAGLLCGSFLIIDLLFFGANLLKIPVGGWFPLLIAGILFTLMTTWKRGRQLLSIRLSEEILPLPKFIENLKLHPPQRVPGVSIFLHSVPSGTPPALAFLLKHFQVLHEQTLFLSITTTETPHVKPAERVQIQELEEGLYYVILQYGFMEDPDIPLAIRSNTILKDIIKNPKEITYVLGREHLIPTSRPGMALWREKLFVAMSQNAGSAAAYFHIPWKRVIEIGIQLDI